MQRNPWVVAVTDEYSAGMHGLLSVGYTTHTGPVYIVAQLSRRPYTVYAVRYVVGYWFSIQFNMWWIS